MTADPSPVFYLRCCCFLFFWNSILDSLCDDNKQCGLILSSCLDILTTFYPTVEFLYQLDICHLGSNIDTYVTFNNEASYHYHEVYFSFLKSFLLHLHLPLVLLSTLCVFRHDIDMRNSVKTRPPGAGLHCFPPRATQCLVLWQREGVQRSPSTVQLESEFRADNTGYRLTETRNKQTAATPMQNFTDAVVEPVIFNDRALLGLVCNSPHSTWALFRFCVASAQCPRLS